MHPAACSPACPPWRDSVFRFPWFQSFCRFPDSPLAGKEKLALRLWSPPSIHPSNIPACHLSRAGLLVLDVSILCRLQLEALGTPRCLLSAVPQRNCREFQGVSLCSRDRRRSSKAFRGPDRRQLLISIARSLGAHSKNRTHRNNPWLGKDPRRPQTPLAHASRPIQV